MQNMKRLLIVILFLLYPFTSYAWVAKVVSVTDGDTINVYNTEFGQVKIRFYGIDTPEKGQAFGQAATKHLASMIAGKMVEVEPVDTDRYGRTVGIISYDGRNINEQIIHGHLKRTKLKPFSFYICKKVSYGINNYSTKR